MFRSLHQNKAVATTQYILLIFFILAALFFFQKYIYRAIMGKWHGVGDAFGFGRQYSTERTVDCAFDSQVQGVWYDKDCADKFGCSSSDDKCVQLSVTSCRRVECDQ